MDKSIALGPVIREEVNLVTSSYHSKYFVLLHEMETAFHKFSRK